MFKRFDEMKEQLQAKLDLQVEGVQRLQAELQQSQDLLDTVERGINNLYFRISCVPVEVSLNVPLTFCSVLYFRILFFCFLTL